MKTNKMRCPNCHAFKLESEKMKLWGMAMLCFIFGSILLPVFVGLLLYAYAIFELIQLPSARGKIRCKSCGWQGKTLEIINLQSNI
jgi:hypothetical protein